MQMRINFLYPPNFFWINPNRATPKIPEIIGVPPTQATANGRSSPPNQGASKNESITQIPLKIPK